MSLSPVTTDICHALQQGKLCCVTRAQSSRQSSRQASQPSNQPPSLCDHTRNEMIARGYRSVMIQLSTLIGPFSDPLNNQPERQPSTPIKWDKYLIKVLWDSFYPNNHVRLSNWLKTTEALSPRERLIQFSDDLLLSELCGSPITIFIDSIDLLVDVPAAMSDMFAWIDYCYELRDLYLSYHHLSFAVFGQVDLSQSDIAADIISEIATDRPKAFYKELPDSEQKSHLYQSYSYQPQSFRAFYTDTFCANTLSSATQFHQSCPLLV